MLFIWQTVLHLLAVSCVTDLVTPVLSAEVYNKVSNGSLCIRSNFTEVRSEAINERICALACSKNPRCQAFSMADGPCQLFVFDRCSKSVRDCSCSRRGQVFVKQQPGLEPGALCPSGYGDDLCGVKYKVFSEEEPWQQGREKCESESGLVIMADVVDATEMEHVEMLYSKYNTGSSFWLGGAQAPGSPEPAGGWFWVACDLPVDSGLWGSGEPNNVGGTESVIVSFFSGSKLLDVSGSLNRRVVCECSSPFD